MAHRISQALDLRSISRSKLAETLGVDRSTVDRWVNGDRHPDTATLERIATVCGVRAAWLAFNEGAP